MMFMFIVKLKHMKNSKGIDPTKSIAEAYVAMNEVVTEAFSAYQNLSRRQKNQGAETAFKAAVISHEANSIGKQASSSGAPHQHMMAHYAHLHAAELHNSAAGQKATDDNYHKKASADHTASAEKHKKLSGLVSESATSENSSRERTHFGRKLGMAAIHKANDATTDAEDLSDIAHGTDTRETYPHQHHSPKHTWDSGNNKNLHMLAHHAHLHAAEVHKNTHAAEPHQDYLDSAKDHEKSAANHLARAKTANSVR